ncbi:MAG: helix-turn-helix domain-containing protein [Pseudobdellovibrionaceae bacterium]|nr:helix-turn-helix domain-containing protein [Pseudobdellovibrionaceae bacterium]
MTNPIYPAELLDQGGATTNDSSSLKIEKMMSTQEAADFLGISIGSLRNMVSQGKIPFTSWAAEIGVRVPNSEDRDA